MQHVQYGALREQLIGEGQVLAMDQTIDLPGLVMDDSQAEQIGNWRYSSSVDGFYGASLAYMANLAKPYGYRIAYLDFVTPWTHDITLVHEDFSDIAVALFGPDLLNLSDRERYLAHPPGHSHFAECGDRTLSWRHRTDWDALLEDIRTRCDAANLSKHNGHAVPYHLALGPV